MIDMHRHDFVSMFSIAQPYTYRAEKIFIKISCGRMREKEDDKEKRRLAGCTHSSHVGQAGRPGRDANRILDC